MKGLYKWHRRLSLIIALPVLLSAGSGLLHPIMTNIRPAIATQGIRPVPIDSNALKVSLRAALESNHIDSMYNVRIVRIDTNWFYQVQRWPGGEPVYISVRSGTKLFRGDWLYAQWLARQFLEGPAAPTAQTPTSKTPTSQTPTAETPTAAMTAGLTAAPPTMEMPPGDPAGMPDCCGAATTFVLNAKGSKITEAARITGFDLDYNEVNRLLPVYKVAFDRPDGIRIYVETTQDRFALAVDNRRAAFNRVFQYIHTYQWLSFLGEGRRIVEFLLIGLAFVTTILGIVIFFTTKSKKLPGNTYVRARRNHRYTAIFISLFTLMFTFSGAYHAIYKPDHTTRTVMRRFAAHEMNLDFAAVVRATAKPVTDITAVALNDGLYWRTRLKSAATKTAAKDLMRDMQATQPEIAYIDIRTGSILPNGEERYARWLAEYFSGHAESAILSTTLITKFDRDYNFTDKRLPVWKVQYPDHGHERYYVETCSGSLSVRSDDAMLAEGYSFALLHKHEFLGGLGKSTKDVSTMFWAAMQIVLVVLGLVLWFYRIFRKNLRNAPQLPKDRLPPPPPQ